jgi:F-type H+/Na+-transporting ATPase subunit alpha
VRDAVGDTPAEVRERLEGGEELNDEDRDTIIQIARKSLAPFQAEPGAGEKS